MTDNRTTEQTATDRLRAMLDEHGVDWMQGMAWNVTVINGDWLIVEDVDFGTLSVSTTAYQLTPEQAIAATMGGQRSTVEIAELLDEFESDCFMLRVEASETRAKDDVVRESYERIRDEFAGRIAVAGGNGTCEMECEDNIEDMCGEHYVYFIGWTCSECGNQMTSMYESDRPKFCPECGRKVKR